MLNDQPARKMKRTNTWKLAVAAIVIFALIAPSVASAALPRPNHALLTPFQSIGRMKFGTTKATAFTIWGSTSMCSLGSGGRETCAWLSPAPTGFPEEGGVLELGGGRVCGMLMRAGTDAVSGKLMITRLKNWRTKEGVGLGSSLSSAKHVLGGKLVVTKQHVTTAILGGTTASTSKKVEEIQIFKRGCPVT